MPGPYAVRVRTPDGWQDIAMVGPPGPLGPPGPNGTVVVYEQPTAPVAPVIGSVWIDTDETPPTTANTAEVLVTSLPSSPVDGQIVNYLADATNGIVWRLRYRAASTGGFSGTSKWEFVGGSPLFSTVDTAQTYTSASFGYLATPGPNIVIPLVGDYLITVASEMLHSAASQIAFNTFDIVPGSIGQDSDAAIASFSGVNLPFTVAKTRLWTVYTAGAIVKSAYRTTAATATFRYRSLSIIPVRVG